MAKCSFCSWPTLYPKFRSRNVDDVLDEIGFLVRDYKIKEIMDDTGTFPVGDWLREFCKGMIKRGYNEKIFFDCNMRFGALTFEDFKLMKRANFRLLLFGLESANQKTLDRINKNLTVERIIEDCKLARRAGLFPHITIMFGYPWEEYEDALRTLNLGRWLLKKGYAYTVQATLVIPYPGTPLFEECKEKKWLKTLSWERFDMKEPVMNTPIPERVLAKLVQGIYRVSFHPEFIYNRIRSIRDFRDLLYFKRAGIKVLGHIKDFSL
ncbi:MAG: radical SAM protein [Candidatus Omnitrophota bacterium]